ncbi:hypothetical protein CRG98_035222 [Punica granatum]|uniref:Uncharacterized protein n=1 Tax=Punica granatum TaxID=22663 RepID=A0A2I0IK47_PUNGR|nr:hypothetical protein CRG98_035222 [Punica granatum]
MDGQPEVAMKMLLSKSSDVRFLGIHGMGGIGKTTLAKVLFNKPSSSFECYSFLADVREMASHHGIEYLQKKLLSNLNPRIGDTTHISNPIVMIRNSFRIKKVLIILDDIDRKEQIENIVGDAKCFGPGSRIIVTTRDSRVLKIGHEPFHGIIEMEEMNLSEALRLFSWHAFEGDSPPREYKPLSSRAVVACGGLPLALEVLGSLLHGKKKSNPIHMWDACDFHPTLGLNTLISMALVNIVEDDKLWMHDQLRDLGREIVREEGLQHYRKCSRLWICGEEISTTLKSKEGKESIVGLHLDGLYPNATGEVFAGMQNLRFLSLEEAKFGKKFNHPLPELKWLSWHYLPSSLNPAHLNIRKLVVLELPRSSTSKSGVDGIKSSKLTATPDFSRISNLERLTLCKCTNLAKLHRSIVKLKNLRHLDLRYCSSLCELPDELGCLEKLEFMSLYRCARLKKLPNSFGKLKALVALNFSGKVDISTRLVSWIVSMIEMSEMMPFGSTSLWDEVLDLSLLSDFDDQSIIRKIISFVKFVIDEYLAKWLYPQQQELPETFGDLTALTKLDLSYSKVSHLPDSFGNLGNLKELNAKWSSLVAQPKSVGMLKKLETLGLGGCLSLAEIPSEIGGLSSLRILDLSLTAIHQLPSTVTQLYLLQSINLRISSLGKPTEVPTSLNGLPGESSDSPLSLELLQWVTPLPTTFADCSRLEALNLSCEFLKRIPPLPSSLRWLALDGLGNAVEMPYTSNLKNLAGLSIYMSNREELACLLLESLRELRISDCNSLPDLSHLKNLQKFTLLGTASLQEIPGLGKLESLQELCIGDCNSIGSLENLSVLTKLKHLSLHDCRNLKVVEGLDRLSLIEKDVHFADCKCTLCSPRHGLLSAKTLILLVIGVVGIPRWDLPSKIRHFLESPEVNAISSINDGNH